MKSLKKFLSVFLACVMAFGVLSASVFAEDVDAVVPDEDTTVDGGTDATEPADELISLVDVTVSEPVDGEYADGLCIVDTFNTAINFIEWKDYDTGDILYSSDADADVVDAPFYGGFSYEVNLLLKTSDGYAFDAVENMVVTVNGWDADYVEVSEDGKTLAITAVFYCGEVEDDDDGISINFDQILNFLKTLVVTFIRFLGSLVGIK